MKRVAATMQAIATERAEKEALAILRRLGKRRSFSDLFSRVADERLIAQHLDKRRLPAWSDLEELLAIDLDPKVTP